VTYAQRVIARHTGAVAARSAADTRYVSREAVLARWRRDWLIDAVIDHLPEVYHRTRPLWPRSSP
jgi:hypothetical protein